jgi:rod shape-determining protein MreB
LKIVKREFEIMRMFSLYRQKLNTLLSNDIGIDLGTANTLVYMRGRGIVIAEPTVVAMNQKTNRLVAVGKEAKQMLGRTPLHVRVVKPLVEGVISDFEVAEEMLAYLLNKAQRPDRKFLGPRVVVGVPSGVTNVESRAVRDAVRNAGARQVHIVEEPMAAAIGIGLPVSSPLGSMVVDIGGGTTDIALISLGGIVRSQNARNAGDRLDADIVAFIRDEFKMLIGEKTAEQLKIVLGSALPLSEPLEAPVRGRDLVSGLPRELTVTDTDIREAIIRSVGELVERSRETIETAPPEIVADIMRRGIHLSGGGALLRGLPEFFEASLKLPVHLADDPLSSVVRGTGIILEHFEEYRETLQQSEEALPVPY